MDTRANLYGAGQSPTGVNSNDGRPQPDAVSAAYQREIDRYNQAFSDWCEEGTHIENEYLREETKSASRRKFAMLWANVETLKPAVYTKTPTAICSRRYKDRDPIGRVAAELVERATNTTFDLYGADTVFKSVRDDRLLPGRGQAWVRYEATIERYEDPDGAIDERGDPLMRERLKAEKACLDYVHWKDFGHNVARTWADVWLVWRATYQPRADVEKRFGKEKAERLSYNAKMPDSKGDIDPRCKILEIWDKQRNQVAWMTEGYPGFLDSGPPPINFRNGFPCPEPVYGTKTSKQLIPRPDYIYYKDQAKEINDLTDKIGNMSEWLIVKGFVPAAPSDVADPIKEAVREKSNKELFVEVPSMAEWSDRGGINRLIEWLPIDKVVQALEAAIRLRDQLVQDVYQVSGVSDILRGQTDPNETLGAQELKAQTGSRRLRNTKDDVARFCKEAAALVAEVIAEQFSPQSIADITGFKYVSPEEMADRQKRAMAAMVPQMPPMGVGQPLPPNVTPLPGVSPFMPPPIGHNGGPPVDATNGASELEFDDRHIKLLRDDRMRSFRIDIETDSTVAADEQADKQQRMEFVTTVGGFMDKAVEVAMKVPDFAPVMKEMLLHTTRGMRAGRSLEDAIEAAFASAMKKAEAAAASPQEAPPDPRMITAQANAQATQQRTEADIRQGQADLVLQARKQQTDAALTARKQDIDANLQIRKNEDNAMATARARVEQMLTGADVSGMNGGLPR